MTTAVNTPPLTAAFSRNMILNAFRRSVWLQALTRGWEPDAQDNRYVNIPTLDVPSNAVRARTRAQIAAGDNTIQTPTATTQQLVMDQHIEAKIRIEKLDALENPMKDGEYERRTSEQLGVELALAIDTNLATAITGASFAAAQTITMGTAAQVYIPRDNPLSYQTQAGTTDVQREAADMLIVDAILNGLINLTRANVAVDSVTVGPGEISPIFAFIPPEIAARAVRGFIMRGYTDQSAEAGLNSAGLLSSQAFQGSFAGVNLITTTSLARPTGAAHWPIYMGISNAWAAALRPEANSVKRYEDGTTDNFAYVDEYHHLATFGRKQVKAAWILRLNIRSQ